MLVSLLKCKIHRAVVTETELEYEGSITIDAVLAKKAGLLAGEKVLVANLRNGERFETYVIYGRKGSGTICINGAAAHLCETGDEVIVMAWTLLTPEEARKHRAVIVKVDRKNRITKTAGS